MYRTNIGGYRIVSEDEIMMMQYQFEDKQLEDILAKKLHISQLEMLVATLGIFALLKDVYDSHIEVVSDNQAATLLKGYTNGDRCLAIMAGMIADFLVEHRCTMSSIWIPTAENYLADALSRVNKETLYEYTNFITQEFQTVH